MSLKHLASDEHTLSLDEFCNKIKTQSLGATYYAGDYTHQEALLSNLFYESRRESSLSFLGVQDLVEAEIKAMRSLQRRMKKFFNLESKYDSSGNLRSM